MQPNDGNDIVIVSTTQGYPAVRWLDSTDGFLYSYQPLTQSDDHCTANQFPLKSRPNENFPDFLEKTVSTAGDPALRGGIYSKFPGSNP